MRVEVSSSLSVFPYVIVEALVAYAQVQILAKPSTDLLRTPVVFEKQLREAQHGLADSFLVVGPTFAGQTLRSLGAIAFAAGVSAQFSADGGFMNPEVVGDFGLGEAGFDKPILFMKRC